MDQGVILLALVGLVVGAFLLQWIVGRGTAVAVGAVTGNTRRRGLAAVHLKLDFTAPVSGQHIVDRIVETLELSDKRNGSSLKMAAIAPDRSSVLIDQAGWLGRSLVQCLVDTHPSQTGCTGVAAVARWLENEGRVEATEGIERIHKHVRSAVEQAGGTVTESSTD